MEVRSNVGAALPDLDRACNVTGRDVRWTKPVAELARRHDGIPGDIFGIPGDTLVVDGEVKSSPIDESTGDLWKDGQQLKYGMNSHVGIVCERSRVEGEGVLMTNCATQFLPVSPTARARGK